MFPYHHIWKNIYFLIIRRRALEPFSVTYCLVFRIERPTVGDNPKPHKFACSRRLPSSATEA